MNIVRPCLISIHEEYINIAHIIIEEKASFLFYLEQVKSISDKDIFIRQTLKKMNFGKVQFTQNIFSSFTQALSKTMS